MELAENKKHSAGEEDTLQHETDCRETQNGKLNTGKIGEFSVETKFRVMLNQMPDFIFKGSANFSAKKSWKSIWIPNVIILDEITFKKKNPNPHNFAEYVSTHSSNPLCQLKDTHVSKPLVISVSALEQAQAMICPFSLSSPQPDLLSFYSLLDLTGEVLLSLQQITQCSRLQKG